MSELVRTEIADGRCTVTLNRPGTHNALDERLMDGLEAGLEAALGDQSVRYLVLAAEGESFSAGADLNWMRRMAQADLKQNQRDAARLFRLLERLTCCDKPLIARVQGPALGGGMGLVAACDLVAALPSATFGLPEVRLGLAPAMIMPFLLGKLRDSELRWAALVGERFDAETARDVGLVTFVTDDLTATIDGWGRALRKAGPLALARTKRLIHDLRRSDWSHAERLTTEAIAELRLGEEGQEGMRAFLERRKPSWTGSR